MKKVMSGIFGFALAMATMHVTAATFDLGVIPSPAAGAFEIVTFDNVVANDSGDPSGTRFDDMFIFEIQAPASTTDIAIARVPLSQFGVPLFLFDEFESTLVSEGGSRDLFGGDGMSGDLSLAPGVYELNVRGNAIGAVGGFYAGAIAVSAVPIPAAGLLFFSGIAALGLIRSKRASV